MTRRIKLKIKLKLIDRRTPVEGEVGGVAVGRTFGVLSVDVVVDVLLVVVVVDLVVVGVVNVEVVVDVVDVVVVVYFSQVQIGHIIILWVSKLHPSSTHGIKQFGTSVGNGIWQIASY
jgi:hypothetical protein